MREETDRDEARQDSGLRWWVRHAFVPIAIAAIAGVSAITAADVVMGTPAAASVVVVTSMPTGMLADLATSTPDGGTREALTDTPTRTPTPTQTASSTGPSPSALDILGEHVVWSGETLYCIGRAYGVRPAAIAETNSLVPPFNLYPGQMLKIPAVSWTAIPSGPTCQPQFASPFTTAGIATAPAPTVAEATPPSTATPTGTATGTATPTPTPTLTTAPVGSANVTPSIQAYVGVWRNVDPATRSWTTIEITQKVDALVAHFWGACVPSDCDAGVTSAPYTGNPVDMYLDHGFATRSYTLALAGDHLRVTTFTHFTDKSGRADYVSGDFFRR